MTGPRAQEETPGRSLSPGSAPQSPDGDRIDMDFRMPHTVLGMIS